MIFKDKEIIEKLNEINKKVSLLIALFKADKIKSASKKQDSSGGKNV